jgi:DNA (cytosine-5)-methyltransferase 1
MRLLDLFCGAGGCARGYAQAGFEVVGVDLSLRPTYPYAFIQDDALDFPLDGFDVIHASPPCQAYSSATFSARSQGKIYPDLLGRMRARLQASGKPWIIENVVGAPVHSGILLCGSMFGLRIRRHRFFECSHLLFAPAPCRHDDDFVTIMGGSVLRQKRNPAYGGRRGTGAAYLVRQFSIDEGKRAMEIDWECSPTELSQMIPPAYTRWVGQQLLEVL